MIRRVLLLLCTVLLVRPAPAEDRDSKELFNEAPKILATLSEITGWKNPKPVPAEIITRDQLHRFIVDRMKEQMKPEDIRIEDITLKKFGLVPEDFNVEKATADLLTEQAAAFYDYNKKRLFILETQSSMAEKRIALVHELAHALADQNVSLKKYIRQGSSSDDGETAREAVMEGQATWLMWAYTSKVGGGPAEVPDMALRLLGSAPQASDAQYPVFAKAPLYMRESLIFPYTRGLLFQNAIFKRDGKASFDEVFKKPPASTQQILHPEKYIDDVAPEEPKTPQPPRHRKYRELAEGNVGEFDHAVLLRQYGQSPEKAAEIASHWRGGSYRLLESKKNVNEHLLCYAVEWDTPESARTYFNLYEKVLRGKWKKIEVRTHTANELAGTGDDGNFVVRLEGSTVSSLEGLTDDEVN